MNIKRSLAVFALTAVLASSAGAQTLASVGLYDTGELGTVAPYSLISAPGAGYNLYLPTNAVWPLNNVWLDNAGTVNWLGIYGGTVPGPSDAVPTVAQGDYTIRLSFNLSGFNTSTVSFGLRAAADNNLAVYLNDSTTALVNSGTVGSAGANYDTLGHYIYTVPVGTAFNASVNTLDFVVTNLTGSTSNPAGLAVDFTAFTGTAIPEPSTYAMIFGAMTLGLVGWRRFRK